MNRIGSRGPDDLKIMIITTPIRPIPTDYPPYGSLTVMKALRKAGFTNVEFYDIDGTRPTYEEAVDHIANAAPDLLGISGIVSTAYEYPRFPFQ